MVERATPQEFFGLFDDKMIIIGIIVVGIVACVACVTIASMKWGK